MDIVADGLELREQDWIPLERKPLMLARIGPGLMPDDEAEAERRKALEGLRERLRPSQ